MLGLAIWRGALEQVSSLIGVAYAPSALFVIAFGFVLVLLLHFSLVISKLADQNKVLAQRLGLLQQQLDEHGAPPARALENGQDRTSTRRPTRRRAAESERVGARPWRPSWSPTTPSPSSPRRSPRCARSSSPATSSSWSTTPPRTPAPPSPRAGRRDASWSCAVQHRLRRRLPTPAPTRRGRRCCSSATRTRSPAPGALDALRAAATTRPGWGAWQALVTLPGGQEVNTSGGVTHWLGIGWAGAYGSPVEAVDIEPREVSFASGAALTVRREAWEAVGGFEDGVLHVRRGSRPLAAAAARRLGRRHRPAARVEHDYDFAKGDYKWFLLERNRWWTILGAYPGAAALRAPAGAAGRRARAAGRSPRAAAGCARSCAPRRAVIRTLPWALRRRRRVQRTRRASTAAFAAGLGASLDSPFLGPAAEIRPVQALQAGYWNLALRAVEGRGG